MLPNAQLKIFLTASVQVRAKRRYDELVEKGECCDLAEIEKDISERDYRDMHREIAPLKAAEDAVMLDSSELNIDEVVEAIYEIWRKRQGLRHESRTCKNGGILFRGKSCGGYGISGSSRTVRLCIHMARSFIMKK